MPADPSKIDDSGEHDPISTTPAETVGWHHVDKLGPNTDVAVVAFAAGRLLNNLRFNLVQAWVKPYESDGSRTVKPSAARRRSEAIAREIPRIARFLRRTASEREEIQTRLRTIFDDLFDDMPRGDYGGRIDRLFEALDRPETTYPPDLYFEPDVVRSEEREIFWRPVHAGINLARTSLVTGLDDRAHLASRLGEMLDQRLHPEDVQESLLVEEHVATRSGMGFERYVVVLQGAGNLPAKPHWEGDVNQIATELSISEALCPDSMTQLRTATDAEAVALIDSIALRIRKALEPNNRGRSLDQVRAQSDVGRARDPNEDRDQWLYKQCYNMIPHKNIISRLKQNTEGWGHITSVQGIRAAAVRYAERHDLPHPPHRQKK